MKPLWNSLSRRLTVSSRRPPLKTANEYRNGNLSDRLLYDIAVNIVSNVSNGLDELTDNGFERLTQRDLPCFYD